MALTHSLFSPVFGCFATFSPANVIRVKSIASWLFLKANFRTACVPEFVLRPCLEPASTVTPGVLDRLPHHGGEPRRADRVGRDPETAGRGAAVKLPGVDDKPKHKMSEDLLHVSRHPPPL